MTRGRWSGVFVAIVMAVAPAASADDTGPASHPPGGDADSPWVKGVSQERQDRAFALFRQANDAYALGQYGQAIKLYESAIAEWDHPAIHFNMAVCLVQLERPLEAHDSIERSLAYGERALGPKVHKEALAYQKLLNAQLSRIVVVVPQRDVRVSLDGKPLLHGPGRRELVVTPGEHELVGTHDALLTETRRVDARAGKTTEAELKLLRVDQVPTRMERRFSNWIPWATAGAGAGVGLVGLWFHSQSSSDYDQYGKVLTELCPQGCNASSVPDSARDLEKSAELNKTLAIGSYAIGGALIATGVTLFILNQPRAVPVERQIDVQPTLGTDTVGASVRVAF